MAQKQRITLVVCFICFVLLVCMALSRASNQTLHAKEAVLKQDLANLRQAIDQYSQDKNKAPQDLNDLVTAGYLHAIPKTPLP